MCVCFAFSSAGKKVAALSLSLSLSLSPPPPNPFSSNHLDLELRVLMRRVLPRLREQAVVPVDVVRVEPEVALFDVLLDRVAFFGRSDLHLRAGLLGDLADEIEGSVGVFERDVVPPGDGLALVLDEDAEVGRGALALLKFWWKIEEVGVEEVEKGSALLSRLASAGPLLLLLFSSLSLLFLFSSLSLLLFFSSPFLT